MSAPPRRRPRALAAVAKKPRAKARNTGGAFERAVFAVLNDCVRDGVFARWDHYGEKTRRVGKGQVIVVGKAPPDVIALTPDGCVYVAEIKHDLTRVYVATERPDWSASVKQHQRDYLDAVASTEHGVADLIVCVGGEVAVIPWREARARSYLERGDVAEFAAADSNPWFANLVRRRMTVEGL